MRVLITGAGGFVGGHLVRHLRETIPQIELHGTMLPGMSAGTAANDSIEMHALDLCDFNAVSALFARIQPDQIYHLAALAAVARSFQFPWETLENNIHAQVNILEAMRQLDSPPRMVLVSSGEIYGADQNISRPLDENAPFRPNNPYSVSKVTQDMLGFQYAISYNLPIMRARPFNHLGPGQNLGFVAPDFALQIAEIEAGKRDPIIRVGSLTAERDFTDVRDVVRAYRLMMEYGTPGEAYNVASGKMYTIQLVLDTLLRHANVPITVQPDPARMRPHSAPRTWGDASRLRGVTGWQPEIPLETTLLDVLNDFRQRIAAAQ